MSDEKVIESILAADIGSTVTHVALIDQVEGSYRRVAPAEAPTPHSAPAGGVATGLRLDLLPALSRLVEEITGLPAGYFKAISGRGVFHYEQWSATAALTGGGERRYAFPFEPEAIGRSAKLVVGKWSDLGAVERKLAEYGLKATPEQMAAILIAGQRAGVAHHRPLADDEFLAIALAHGAPQGE
jgi:isopropylmalate/homocitrate/citramalate synthase